MIVLQASIGSTKDYWRCVDVLMGICRETVRSSGLCVYWVDIRVFMGAVLFGPYGVLLIYGVYGGY